MCSSDLSDNVWEWTRSLWGEDFRTPEYGYPYDPADAHRELLSAPDSVRRVLRGGSFNDLEDSLRAASRNWDFPDFRYDFIGFRVVSSRLRS